MAVDEKNDWPSDGARKPVLSEPRSTSSGSGCTRTVSLPSMVLPPIVLPTSNAHQAQRSKKHVFGGRRKSLGRRKNHRGPHWRRRWGAACASAEQRGNEKNSEAGRRRHRHNNPELDAAISAVEMETSPPA